MFVYNILKTGHLMDLKKIQRRVCVCVCVCVFIFFPI